MPNWAAQRQSRSLNARGDDPRLMGGLEAPAAGHRPIPQHAREDTHARRTKQTACVYHGPSGGGSERRGWGECSLGLPVRITGRRSPIPSGPRGAPLLPAAADDRFRSAGISRPAIGPATSRCRDVCGFAADDARIAIVRLDRRHDRFGRPGPATGAIGSPRKEQREPVRMLARRPANPCATDRPAGRRRDAAASRQRPARLRRDYRNGCAPMWVARVG